MAVSVTAAGTPIVTKFRNSWHTEGANGALKGEPFVLRENVVNPSSSEMVSLFTRALACTSDAERNALLDQTCAGNTELRAQIDSLLHAHREAGGFLEPKDVNETIISGPGYVSGTVIGQRYKLLEEIAEGGMGTVWLAEQTHPVRRRVAVKVQRASH